MFAANVTPPTVRGALEGFTNKNFYTGFDIVPERLQDASPEQQYTNQNFIGNR